MSVITRNDKASNNKCKRKRISLPRRAGPAVAYAFHILAIRRLFRLDRLDDDFRGLARGQILRPVFAGEKLRQFLVRLRDLVLIVNPDAPACFPWDQLRRDLLGGEVIFEQQGVFLVSNGSNLALDSSFHPPTCNPSVNRYFSKVVTWREVATIGR